MADQQLRAIKAAKLVVVNLHEDDAGMWFCTLADHFRAPMATWKTGKGRSADDAMDQALGFAYKPVIRAREKPAAPVKPKREDRDDFI